MIDIMKERSYKKICIDAITMLPVLFFLVELFRYDAPTYLGGMGSASIISKMLVIGMAGLFFVALSFLLFMAAGKTKGINNTIFFASTAALRIWYGELLGMHFSGPDELYDDRLMIVYSDLKAYFSGTAVDSSSVMLKEMGMPFILNLVDALGISYSAFISLLWIADALLIYCILSRMVGNNVVVPKVAFLLVAFIPVAFESSCGTRLYRNSLLTPLYLMVFSLHFLIMIRLADKRDNDFRKLCLISTFLGVVFSLTYFVKEDGNWLLVSVLFLMIIWIAVGVLSAHKNGSSVRSAAINVALLIAIPMIIFTATTIAYKGINYYAFGIYETNARTKGEAGKFVDNIYKIDSKQKSKKVWAPADAIDKAFANSKTLGNNEALKDEIFHTPWFEGDIINHPIQGDFLTWVMKDAMFRSGTASTKAEAEAYLATVNEELEEAFKEGRLIRDGRFRTVSGLVGITKEDAKDILKTTIKSYPAHILCNVYVPGGAFANGNEEILQQASVIANMNLANITAERAVERRQKEIAIANVIAQCLFDMYGLINTVLCGVAVCGILYSATGTVRKYRSKCSIEYKSVFYSFLSLSMLGISFTLLFHVSWFCMHLPSQGVAFYSIGMIPLIVYFELFGAMPLILIIIGGQTQKTNGRWRKS